MGQIRKDRDPMSDVKKRKLQVWRTRLASWYSKSDWGVYIRHCIALLFPTKVPETVPARRYHAGDTSKWPESSLDLLIQEGRRQNDLQRNSLHHLQLRSQFIFTTGIATLALVGATVIYARSNTLILGFWSAAILLLMMGMLGSAANLGAREGLRQVDFTELTRKTPADLHSLAAEYVRVIKDGGDTAGTRYILYRKSALLQLPGSLTLLAIWISMIAG